MVSKWRNICLKLAVVLWGLCLVYIKEPYIDLALFILSSIIFILIGLNYREENKTKAFKYCIAMCIAFVLGSIYEVITLVF